jgi:hypothetical protein
VRFGFWIGPCQESSAIRAIKPPLICSNFIITLRKLQLFSCLLFKIPRLLYTTPSQNFAIQFRLLGV